MGVLSQKMCILQPAKSVNRSRLKTPQENKVNTIISFDKIIATVTNNDNSAAPSILVRVGPVEAF